MNYDRECGYKTIMAIDDLVEELAACCPECGSLDIELESGDHGYECQECGETFICP